MIRLVQRKLIIPRGDTGTFSVPVMPTTNLDNAAVFTIYSPMTNSKVFQKLATVDNKLLVVSFTHADTVNLPIGKYKWDIKFYQNPVFVEGELVDGTEVDSYYAAFSVPDCEIRQTGDKLLTSEDAPTATVSPEYLNIVSAGLAEMQQSKNAAANSAASAADSAAAAEAAAQHTAELAAEADSQIEAATEKAEEALDYLERAEAACDDIMDDAAAAEEAKEAAQQAASDAQNSALAAEAAEDAATAAAATATQKATEAGTSATSAADSAAAAAQSATQAANSASAASASETAAAESATSAEESNQSAIASAATATEKANDAATSAAEANSILSELVHLSATATSLGPNERPTAEYDRGTGILHLGIPQGKGIANVRLNPDYSLTVTLTDGSSMNTSSIRGEKGEKGDTGDAFHIKKTYTSIAQMEADYSNPLIAIGEFVMITSNVDDPDNAKVYVKGDTRFNYIVDMSGATGIQGPPGERGPVGPQGEQGPQGETGSEYTVLIQDTEPTEEDNKIWIPLTSGTVMTVPSVDEMNAALAGKVSQPATAGTEGQVLKLDSNLEPVWGDAAEAGAYAEKVDTVLETTLSRGRKSGTTVGTASFAFGQNVEASGAWSHAEGRDTTANHQGSHAEGLGTTARYAAHAEGENTYAEGQWSHAEGLATTAQGAASHAEGEGTIAVATASHVVGRINAIDSYDNWPTWVANTSYSVGDRVKRVQTVNNKQSTIGYICKTANNDSTFTIANWDFDSNHMNFVEIVGNGTSGEDPTTHQEVRNGSNARALDWYGNEYLAGDLYVHANANSTGGVKVATVNDIPVPTAPATDGVALVSVDGAWTQQDGYGYINNTNEYGNVLLEETNLELYDGHGYTYSICTPTTKHISVFINNIEYDYEIDDEINTDYAFKYISNDVVAPASNITFSLGIDGSNYVIDYYIEFYITDSSLGDNITIKIVEKKDTCHKINNKYLNAKSGAGYETIVENDTVVTDGVLSHAEGAHTKALAHATHAEGKMSVAWGVAAHAEGVETIASGSGSHSEGISTKARGSGSHAEGHFTNVEGTAAHVEGFYTTSKSYYSHVSGKYNVEDNCDAWPEWTANTTYHIGDKVKRTSYGRITPYICKVENTDTKFTYSHWTVVYEREYAEIVGNGTADNARSNARALGWDGNEYLMGDLFLHCAANSTNGVSVSSKLTAFESAVGDVLAPNETDLVASQAYAAGDLLTVGNKLYKTTAAIAQDGAIITDGASANVEETKVVDEFAKITDISVSDVQVDGTSIIQNGIAVLNKASASTYGVVKVGSGNDGVFIANNGLLMLSTATDNQIKTGSATYPRAITPGTQSKAVFYGLAQAAGDATQSSSDNAVGTYTDDAKAAIQSMLGVTDEITDLQNAIDDKEDKTDLIVTFTITASSGASSGFAATSDVLASDIVQAYNTGKSIKAYFSFDVMPEGSPLVFPTPLNVITFIPGMEYIMASHEVYVESPVIITVFGMSGTSGTDDRWEVQISRPLVDNQGSVYASGATIKNLSDPTDATDATTKRYVDTAVGAKQDKPSTNGTAGQVLSLDSNLNPIWTTVSSDVSDVQVNGTSIVNSGVANVPVASSSEYGVVKVGGGQYGISISSGIIQTSVATDAEVKAGGNGKKPIVPQSQHQAVFYGLAKAAGDSTQASSNNAVGTYTSDAKVAIRKMLGAFGASNISQRGLYVEEDMETGEQFVGTDVQDVQINGTSIVNNYVANIPVANASTFGVVKSKSSNGVQIWETDGTIMIVKASDADVKAGTNNYYPIVPSREHAATFYGLAKAAGDSTQSASSNAIGTYTAQAKQAIKQMLGVADGMDEIEITGATPTITAVENTRYICGEVTSLTFTPSASGVCDIVFTSGTTPTILTVPAGTKFQPGFDYTSLLANMVYEINFLNGNYAVVATWES